MCYVYIYIYIYINIYIYTHTHTHTHTSHMHIAGLSSGAIRILGVELNTPQPRMYTFSDLHGLKSNVSHVDWSKGGDVLRADSEDSAEVRIIMFLHVCVCIFVCVCVCVCVLSVFVCVRE